MFKDCWVRCIVWRLLSQVYCWDIAESGILLRDCWVRCIVERLLSQVYCLEIAESGVLLRDCWVRYIVERLLSQVYCWEIAESGVLLRDCWVGCIVERLLSQVYWWDISGALLSMLCCLDIIRSLSWHYSVIIRTLLGHLNCEDIIKSYVLFGHYWVMCIIGHCWVCFDQFLSNLCCYNIIWLCLLLGYLVYCLHIIMSCNWTILLHALFSTCLARKRGHSLSHNFRRRIDSHSGIVAPFSTCRSSMVHGVFSPMYSHLV